MKILSVLLCLLLLTGCSIGAKLDAAEDTIENKIDAMEDAAETSAAPAPSNKENLITQEEAETIALEHAGLTADQVTGLRTDYEVDDGVPEYEVEFHVERTEYDYTIHAETGKILSYDMDT